MELKRFEYSDCLREGLLKKFPVSNEKAQSSILSSDKWLDEAKKCLSNGTFSASVLSSYLSMFHSSRSVLFLDGFREKSHFCIARYLEEKYVKTGLLENKWIELLDHYRELRHNSQYDVNFFATDNDARNAARVAKEFNERIKRLVSKRL